MNSITGMVSSSLVWRTHRSLLYAPGSVGISLFKGRTDFCFHRIKKRSPKEIAKKSIVEVIEITPKAVITVSTFQDEAIDMGVPFKVLAKGVEDHDKAGSEIQGFILFKKHAGNNTVYRMKKAVKEGAVKEEKVPELGINGKDTMPVEQSFLDNLNNQKPKSMEEVERIWYEGESRREKHYDKSRYHCLNLHSALQKGTVEFRLLNGAVHGRRHWFRLWCVEKGVELLWTRMKF